MQIKIMPQFFMRVQILNLFKPLEVQGPSARPEAKTELRCILGFIGIKRLALLNIFLTSSKILIKCSTI